VGPLVAAAARGGCRRRAAPWRASRRRLQLRRPCPVACVNAGDSRRHVARAREGRPPPQRPRAALAAAPHGRPRTRGRPPPPRRLTQGVYGFKCDLALAPGVHLDGGRRQEERDAPVQCAGEPVVHSADLREGHRPSAAVEGGQERHGGRKSGRQLGFGAAFAAAERALRFVGRSRGGGRPAAGRRRRRAGVRLVAALRVTGRSLARPTLDAPQPCSPCSPAPTARPPPWRPPPAAARPRCPPRRTSPRRPASHAGGASWGRCATIGREWP